MNTRENAMKFIKELLKIISAGIVSVAIVCGLLCFYDIKPIHKENPKRNTDYVCPQIPYGSKLQRVSLLAKTMLTVLIINP